MASLSIKDADEQTLLFCHAGCPTEHVLESMGLSWEALWANGKASGVFSPPKPEATYIYDDERGSELFRIIRYADPKRFIRRSRTVPYRLLAVIGAVKEGTTVYIVEGEKDVHALERVGKIATCNSGGAGSWKPEYDKYFRNAKVIVVADNDDPGIRHAKDVAAMLYSVASSIWIVQSLVGKDVAEHLELDLRIEDMHVVERVK